MITQEVHSTAPDIKRRGHQIWRGIFERRALLALLTLIACLTAISFNLPNRASAQTTFPDPNVTGLPEPKFHTEGKA